MKKTMSYVFLTLMISGTQALAAQPSPFAPVREEQVPSGMPYSLTMPPVENPEMFNGKRVAILASHGVEEAEITFPYAYLVNRGAPVDILVLEWTAQGITAVRY